MKKPSLDESIVVRKPRFCMDGVAAIWDKTGPHKTSIINAFSFVAPIFERTACLVVRDTFAQIKNQKLREDAILFVQQEAQHSKVHQDLNDYLFANGLDDIRENIDFLLKCAEDDFNKLDPKRRLATVAAGEHIICCFSNWILDSRFSQSMHPVMRDLYLWHSLEEVEHASISFDIFTDLHGSSAISYGTRVMGYIRAIRYVMGRLLKIYFLVADKFDNQETLSQLIARRFLIVKTGIVKSGPFIAYFMPFFHPDILKPRNFEANKPSYEAMIRPYIDIGISARS